MASYNSKRFYNKKLPDSGANYNSGPFAIVILDGARGIDIVNDIFANAFVSDTGVGDDDVSLNVNLKVLDQSISSNDNISIIMNADILDSGNSIDAIDIPPIPIDILDIATSTDEIILLPVLVNLEDLARGNDNTSISVNVDISDLANSIDLVEVPPIHIDISDSADGADKVTLLPILINLGDSAKGNDNISISANVNLSDLAKGVESLAVSANLDVSDSGIGIEVIYAVGAFFVIDSNNILHPLGVLVTGDSRHELLPSTRDNTEEITGRHGEMDFGTEFNARLMELHVATNEGNTPLEKTHLQRLFAKYLDPTKGAKTLIFSDDIEKSYMVKYSGKIDPTNHPTWFEFTLPFKMSDPFINGSFEKSLIGSGSLANEGTFETGLLVEIAGPITNPSLNIGGQVLSYTGTISSGQRLIIDTERETARVGSSNAIGGYNGVFPLLYPGETNVVTTNNTTIRWRDKWI